MDCVLLLCSLTFLILKTSKAHIYTHTWAAHIDGGEEVARQLAEKHGFTFHGTIFDDHYHLSHSHVMKRSATPSDVHHNNLNQESEVKWLEQQVVKKRVKRDIHFDDPKWPKMWYLGRGKGLDMNVEPAWEKGYKGKGVVVSILDDGIEKDHPDLKKNYDPKASYDVNSHDPDPQPRYDYTNENRHGTRCAGEVAAEANNGVCSVGAAYEAGIGGVRMLDGDVTDAVEAASLSLNPQHIDIYSASWGPDDDGRTVDGPARLAQKAFRDGIVKGRGGKGSIFVWASGNGGRDEDSCNCDGYTNSIFTLSISSATESGHIPWYSEACSSTLSTTYSSGSGKEHQVVTTDLRKSCTETHTGTSASAPLAAGICALALSANQGLTWRDMQHIVVMTSRPANLKATDWVTNGVGRKVSHSFGFGLMDASAMVDLALNWTSVPKQHKCEIRSRDSPRGISVNGKVSVSLQSHGCQNTDDEVIYLEHVQAMITLTTTRRGQVQIFLTSPQGTRSTLLTRRPRDTSTEGFNEWAFMTTHNWGEYSLGTWTLEIVNDGATFIGLSPRLRYWSLVLFGTDRHPLSTTKAPIPTTPPTPTPPPPSTTLLPETAPPRPERFDWNNMPYKAITVGPCTKPPTRMPPRLPKYRQHPRPRPPKGPKNPTRRPHGRVPSATLNSWSLNMYGTSTDPLKDQSKQHPHPHSQDCIDGILPLFNNKCVEKCPLSYYAANQTTTAPATTKTSSTTSATSTKATMQTTKPTITTTLASPTSTTRTTTTSSSMLTTVITEGATKEANETFTTQICKPCSDGCAKCVTENQCLECLTGYNMTGNETCVSVNSGIIHYFKTHIGIAYSVVTVILCSIAVIIFLFVFCILQLMEPGSCISKHTYVPVNCSNENGDAELGKNRIPSKLSSLKNGGGVHYKNGKKEYDKKGLLDSSDSENEMFESTNSSSFHSQRLNNFS